MKNWIVTRAIDAYDQDGNYFVAVFNHKPTLKDLRKLLPKEYDTTIEHLSRGGGRREGDGKWFDLWEVESGVNFEEL